MLNDRLYQHAPIFMQNLLCSGYGYLLNRKRYNSAYRALERLVFRRDHLSPEALQDLQCQRVQAIVKHASQHIPYYREQFCRYAIDPAQIQNPDDLSRLPVLDKETLRDHSRLFVADNLSDMSYSTIKTSGTTGTSLIFPMTQQAEQEQWAIWWRYRARFGIDHQTFYAHFYGKSIVPFEQKCPPFWRLNSAGRQLFFSAYHMTEKNMRSYVDALNRYQPPWIQGYPSLLSLLADYMLANQLQLDYQPAVITIGSESLLAHQQQKIEQAFGASCRQHYGMTEAVANISECEYGKLHIDEDFGHIEFVPNRQGSADLLCTGYSNQAFVLLRYHVGDSASLTAEACACGRAGRIVAAIDGRIEDYVVTPDGRQIGRLDHIFKDMQCVRESQIVQESPARVRFNIVKAASYDQLAEQRLLQEARKRLGNELQIEFSYLPSIPRSATGKLRFVVSHLDS